MDYAEAFQALQHAGDAAEMPIESEAPPADGAFLRTVFGDDLAEAIAAAGYPGGAEVPWSVEELLVYRLDELEAKQAGYRTNAATGALSDGWDQSRYVIADWAANPVSIAADGSIAWSRHGEGSWSYHPLAVDLPQFLGLLAGWLRYFIVEQGGTLFDDDFEIPQAKRDEVLDTVLAPLAASDRDAALRFLLGEI